MTTILGTSIVMCLVGMSVSQEAFYVIHKVDGEYEVPMDITYNDVDNTSLIVVGESTCNDSHDYVATINLHDHEMGYDAFKSVSDKLCLISTTHMPVATVDKYREGWTNETLHFDAHVVRELLTHQQVVDIAGQNIASFCKNYKTLLMHHTRSESAGTNIRNRRGSITIRVFSVEIKITWGLDRLD